MSEKNSSTTREWILARAAWAPEGRLVAYTPDMKWPDGPAIRVREVASDLHDYQRLQSEAGNGGYKHSPSQAPIEVRVRNIIQAMRTFKFPPVVFVNQDLDHIQTWAMMLEQTLDEISSESPSSAPTRLELEDIKKSTYYRGDGEHSVLEMQTLIKERNEEIIELRALAQRFFKAAESPSLVLPNDVLDNEIRKQAERHTLSVWAPGEMYPNHMTEAYVEGAKKASELITAHLAVTLTTEPETPKPTETVQMQAVVGEVRKGKPRNYPDADLGTIADNLGVNFDDPVSPELAKALADRKAEIFRSMLRERTVERDQLKERIAELESDLQDAKYHLKIEFDGKCVALERIRELEVKLAEPVPTNMLETRIKDQSETIATLKQLHDATVIQLQQRIEELEAEVEQLRYQSLEGLDSNGPKLPTWDPWCSEIKILVPMRLAAVLEGKPTREVVDECIATANRKIRNLMMEVQERYGDAHKLEHQRDAALARISQLEAEIKQLKEGAK